MFIFLLFGSVLFAAVPPQPKLVILAPQKHHNLAPMGVLNATLIDEDNHSILQVINKKFGDCDGCARGVAVKGDLGVTFEGLRIAELESRRKQSSKVSLLDCPQGRINEQEFTCKFKSKDINYRLTLKVE